MTLDDKPDLLALIVSCADARSIRRPSGDGLERWWDYLRGFDRELAFKAIRYIDCDSERMPTPAQVRAFIKAERADQARSHRCMYQHEGERCDEMGDGFSIGTHGHKKYWCARHKHPANRNGPANPNKRPYEPRGGDIFMVRSLLASKLDRASVVCDYGERCVAWVEANTTKDEWAEIKRLAANKVTRLRVPAARPIRTEQQAT